jgi:hypothetical protein
VADAAQTGYLDSQIGAGNIHAHAADHDWY